MKRILSSTLLWTLTATLVLAPAPALGQDLFGKSTGAETQADRVEPGHEVEVRIVPSRTTPRPGDTLTIAFVMDHAQGWHSWPAKAQDVLPKSLAKFAIRTQAGLTGAAPGWIAQVGPVQWPEPQLASVANISTGVGTMEVKTYQGKAVAYLPLILAADAQPRAYTLDLRLYFQTCNESVCLPPRTETRSLSFTVVAPGQGGAAPSADADLFAGFDRSVFAKMRSGKAAAPSAVAPISFNAFGVGFDLNPSGAVGFTLLLLTAALGGFLLNLTPCVLPVIPIKIMGLSQSAGNPRKTLLLGAVMSIGVISFWMAIGLAIAFLSGFDSISSLFQTSWFALAVGAFIAVMSVGMLGVFTVKLPNAVSAISPSHDSAGGSFLFGVMTAVLSTPCTAPFMGTAAAWAATRSAPVVLIAFASIGLGMALPYLLLSANTKWIEKVPRTGPASELVKQVMGLLMLAVAVFFIGTGLAALRANPSHEAPQWHWWIIAGLVVASMGWLALRTFQITPRISTRLLFGLIALTVSTGAIFAGELLTRTPPIDWVMYTPGALSSARERGDIVLVDFTAEWCLNCKALERGVLFNKRVVGAIEEHGVVALKVDLTGDNPEGQAFLKSVGGVAIPLLLIYGPANQDPWRSDSYTIEQVVRAIDRAGG